MSVTNRSEKKQRIAIEWKYPESSTGSIKVKGIIFKDLAHGS